MTMILQGDWTEDEISLLQESYQPQDDYKEAVREVVSLFPERGIQEVTRQLRAMGLIPERKNKKKNKSDSPSENKRSKYVHD